jgi:putative N6-adenine-specific DNA methylase
MCGSGTLVIEAGLIARGRAPSLQRTFAVERWPHQGASARELLMDLREEARSKEHPARFPIWGCDRDEEAIAAARANVKAAGLSDTVTLEEADATGPLPIPKDTKGLLVTNPPYGDRLTAGGQKGMKTFYFKLGESLARYPGLRMAILCGNEAFESAFHARPNRKRTMWNGPIRCELLGYPARSGS